MTAPKRAYASEPGRVPSLADELRALSFESSAYGRVLQLDDALAAVAGRSPSLSPEALLTWEAVRRLEQHTDIGPGNVGPLLMQVNLRQYEHALAVLREAGYTVTAPARTPTDAKPDSGPPS